MYNLELYDYASSIYMLTSTVMIQACCIHSMVQSENYIPNAYAPPIACARAFCL